jgi:hypothetical protein
MEDRAVLVIVLILFTAAAALRIILALQRAGQQQEQVLLYSISPPHNIRGSSEVQHALGGAAKRFKFKEMRLVLILAQIQVGRNRGAMPAEGAALALILKIQMALHVACRYHKRAPIFPIILFQPPSGVERAHFAKQLHKDGHRRIVSGVIRAKGHIQESRMRALNCTFIQS